MGSGWMMIKKAASLVEGAAFKIGLFLQKEEMNELSKRLC